MSRRNRIGLRRYSATFEQHNGNQDSSGNPTYPVAADWSPTVAGWPVEFAGTSGTETPRGGQVSAETTHLIFGEYYGGEGISPLQRCYVDGRQFGVVSVLDVDGDHMEKRVELQETIRA